MALVIKGRWLVFQLLTAVMAFFLDFRLGPVSPDHQAGKADGPRVSGGFRLPLSTAYATMHVNTLANLSTVLRFKREVLNKNEEEIDHYTNGAIQKASDTGTSANMDEVIQSTKRLMILNDALQTRIDSDTGQRESNPAMDTLYNDALKAKNAGDINALKNANTKLMKMASGSNSRIRKLSAQRKASGTGSAGAVGHMKLKALQERRK